MGRVLTDRQITATARGRALARLATLHHVDFERLVAEEIAFLRSKRGDELRQRVKRGQGVRGVHSNVIILDEYRGDR